MRERAVPVMGVCRSRIWLFRTFTAAILVVAAAALMPAALAADTDSDLLPDEWEIEYFSDLDEVSTGDPDSDGYSNLAEYNNGTNPAVAETAPPYLTTIDWTAVGPGGGGAQYSPAIAPNNPDLMYGICDMGGFYRSTDGGHSWRMYGRDQVGHPIAYSPSHCNPIFNPFDENICFMGSRQGLRRTTDGGESWTLVTGGRPQAIAIHRGATNVIIYGNDDERLYKSVNGGDSFAELAGWRTSVNKTIMDLYIDPASPAGNLVIFAATASGIYKSVNDGASWSTIHTGLPSTSVHDFNGAVKGSQLALYATIGGHGVYKSTNGGTSWSAKNSGFNVGAAGHMELGVCEGNADILYVGSQENGGPTVYKSTNGGDSWSMVLTSPSAGNFPSGIAVARDWMTVSLGWAWGEEPHEIMVCPTDGNRAAFSEDGRTWRTDTGGTSWFCVNDHETSVGSNWWTSTGFETTTNYWVHFSPWDHDLSYITYTDVGFFRSQDRGYSWRWSATGSPWRNTYYDIEFDPAVPGRMWACASNHHDLPHEKILRMSAFPNLSGGVLISNDYGATWSDLGHASGLPVGAPTSIVIDPTSPVGARVLYVTVIGKGVYKSANGGASWAAVNTGLGLPNNMNAWLIRRMADGTLYCALTEAMNTSNQRFAGGLFKSENGGASWTQVNQSQQIPYIASFSVDDADQDRIYVASFNMAGTGLGGLWKTENGGTTWTRTFNLGDTYAADMDPSDHSRVYATINMGEDWQTEGGVYLSEDYGDTWRKAEGLPFETYGPNSVSFDPDDSEIIYITTFGGGVWKAQIVHDDLPSAAFTATPASGEAPLSVDFDSSACTGDVTTHTWDFDDASFSHEAAPTHVFASEGNYTVTLKVEGRTGSDTFSAFVAAAPNYSTDSDSDGLPDAWEMEHFGDLDETSSGDPDGDGATNGEELGAGTDPTQKDTQGPVVSSVATVPAAVRQNLDRQIVLTALGSDTARGNSKIVAGEYFIGADPGAGNGTALSAADGSFNSPVESLTGVVNTSTWTQGSYRIYVRARDASGFWGSVATILVSVVDGIAPAACAKLSLEPTLNFDKIAEVGWFTAGTVMAADEEITIDLGALETVGAVSLEPSTPPSLFPQDFSILASPDGADWTTLAQARFFRAARGESLWQFEPASYRYVKLVAAGIRNPRDRHYYVQMAAIRVYTSSPGHHLRASWTATADDGNLASSGPATIYDLRYSASPISAANFDSCAKAAPMPPPGPKGTVEDVSFSTGSASGDIYAALKIGDEVPNWSPMSRVATANLAVVGLEPQHPEDGLSAVPGYAVQFTFTRGADVKQAWAVFSDRPDFPARALKNGDGSISRTVRFPLRPLVSWWRPSPGQWKAIKKLAGRNGTVYWRLEGKHLHYAAIFSPTRSMFFDTGEITGLVVIPSHAHGSDEAVWPEALAAPTFSWTDATQGMRRFYLDVSTSASIPLTDRRSTLILGANRIAGSSYRLSVMDWKRVRRLAVAGQGTLFCRVRAQDADRALSCAGAVKKLVVDGGTWSVSAIDLSSDTPSVTWDHVGEGIVAHNIEFSVDSAFEKSPRYTLKVPSRGIPGSAYTLSPAERRRLLLFSERNGLANIYYRVRGEDADRSFYTHSDTQSTPAP